MTETRVSYLTRVVPDLAEIAADIEEARSRAPQPAEYHLKRAISRTQKLLEDLQRAERAAS